MIYDILEKKLTDSGLVVAGESLFRHDMDGACLVGVMIKAPLTGIKIDPHIEGWYQPTLQIIVRHTDPVDGETLANNVIKTLLVQGRETYPANAERGPAHLDLFYPESAPIRFPRLEGNGLEWSINFKTVFGVVPAWR